MGETQPPVFATATEPGAPTASGVGEAANPDLRKTDGATPDTGAAQRGGGKADAGILDAVGSDTLRLEDASLARLADHLSVAEPPPEEAVVMKAAVAGGQTDAFSLADDPELIADFVQEATEHLGSIETLTLEIEQTPDDREALNALFRSFHSIKGLAGFLELHAIRELAHQVETLLDLARNGEVRIAGPAIDSILAGADFIRRGVDALTGRLQGNPVPLPPLDEALCHAVARLCERPAATDAAPFDEPVQGEPVQGEPVMGKPVLGKPEATSAFMPGEGLAESLEAEERGAGPSPQEVAVPPSLLEPGCPDSAASWAKAPIEERGAPQEKISGTGAKAVAGGPNCTGSVKVETAKLDYLVDMVGEFVIAQSIVRHDPDLRLAEHPRLQRNFAQLARITAEIQRTAMSMRMVPIQGLFQRMARLVRDLARKTGKDVEFVSVGEETELDRTLIEQLADPLMHMVRNSLDHGLEPAAERERAGKNPRGRVQMRAAHESGGIVIEISDDGRGLSREKILARAIERGMLPANANPPDAEVWGLIFEPGFSTAEKVTDISGRGVGMDVVRRNIQQLRGRIEVSSVSGQGTVVLLRLPLTLAIIDALLVGIGSERFILPMYAVREMFRPAAGAVHRVRGRGGAGGSDEVVDVRGNLLPVHRMETILGVRTHCREADQGLLVVLENQSGQFCLLVDEFLGKQEVVIKPLGAMFRNIPGISSGAILGDGKVALILDVDGLLRRKSNAAGMHPGQPVALQREDAHD